MIAAPGLIRRQPEQLVQTTGTEFGAQGREFGEPTEVIPAISAGSGST
jgi:hypothetical protein